MPQALFVLGAFRYILHKYHHSYSEHDKEAKIQGGKQADILCGLALDVRCVLAEGYKTCKGRDKCSHAADINTQEELLVVCCKFREQNC